MSAICSMQWIDYLTLLCILAPGTEETWGQLCCMAEQLQAQRQLEEMTREQ